MYFYMILYIIMKRRTKMADFNEKMQNEIDTNTEETVKIHLDEESDL